MANSSSGESIIDRVVRILDTFSPQRTSQTATEVGRRAALPPSTAHRLVNDLVEAGLLERTDDNQIRLGLRLWELALRGSTVLRLRQAALPVMEEIQARLRQHTQLAVLEQDQALFIERLSHPHGVENIALVAGRLPLHASSSGLVLLAHAPAHVRERVLNAPLPKVGPKTTTDPALLERQLRAIRSRGYVISPATVQAIATGIAVPIRDKAVVSAALSVVLPRSTPPEPALEVLSRAVPRIEEELRRERH